MSERSATAETGSSGTGNGRGRTPPGPRGHWLLGMMPEILRDPLGFRMRMLREYGDVVRYRFVRTYSYLLLHPDHVQHVLVDNQRNYRKGFPTGTPFLRLLGNGLLAANGDFWLRQRRLAQPAFQRGRIEAMGEVMTGSAERLARRWEAHGERPLNVAAEMTELTLRIAGLTLFGLDLSDQSSVVGTAFSNILSSGLTASGWRAVYLGLWKFLPWLPEPRYPAFERELARLEKVVHGIIAERRHENTDRGDLLSMFMLARDEASGEAMDDRQLRDEVLTMLLAGHETTSNALSWTWYLLSQHPQAETRLHAELDAVLGGRLPTAADLPRLDYTGRLFKESLRLYPPAPVFTRVAVADDTIGGFHVPAGADVILSPYATHRHPGLWEDPERFDPDRFLPEPSRTRPRFAYIPFGGGPRQCIGNTFAQTEALLVLATLGQRFRLRLAPGHEVVPQSVLTLRPRGGLPMTLHPRARRTGPQA